MLSNDLELQYKEQSNNRRRPEEEILQSESNKPLTVLNAEGSSSTM